MFRLCFVWVYIIRDSSLDSACGSMAGFVSVRTRADKEKFSYLPEVVLMLGKEKRLSSGFIVVHFYGIVDF